MVPTSRAILETEAQDASVERSLHYYSKGEPIPTKSQGVWQVCKGLVQLSTLYPSGEERLLGWVGPSMCFGPWLTFLHIYQARALSDVYLMWFSVGEIEASPELSHQLLPQLNRRLRQMEALLAISGLRRVEDRLHQLLVLLKQEIGQPVAGGTRLNVRLTHQDLASAISTSRVTVTRLFGQLKQQGLIAIDSKRHIILKDAGFAGAACPGVLRA
ncbi:Crp/Fnr family transcriptional regulator [Kamptonema formosum]|uniref:Crp/Fnr family transcriptional regulator n=1 Tax=Kamptonema formosum TaxID=331992 RepID=UPI00034C486C|nr:Crp/Fnr family transcriptional regulator [Oscillatoria sp. PCC 10802]